jgi:DNA-binding LacI/PurR family transcriptional regulator
MSSRSSRRATIHDVARAAGVSRQTVSNALNNPQRVRPVTLERVRTEIDRLGYRPSSAARVMRSSRAGAVGVEMNVRARQGSDVAPLVLSQLTVRAPRYGVHLVPFADSTLFPTLAGYQDMVRRHLVDAFVFADTHRDDPRPDWLVAEGIPFAAFGRIYGRPELGSWVDVDGQMGTRQAVEHLVAREYRTVAYLGWPLKDDGAVAQDRREGWREAADRLGVSGPEARCEQDLRAALAAAGTLLDELGPGDALVCASDLLALGAGYAAAARGLRIGRDLGLVGFDGSLVASRHGLTTVVQPFEALAEELLRLVHDQLAGGAPASAGQLLTPTLALGPSTDRDLASEGFIPTPCQGAPA